VGVLRVVTYAVDGWGVGELALVDDRPISHELPVPARPATRDHVADADELAGRPADALSRLLAVIYAFFRGERVSWTTHEIGLEESVVEWGLSPFMQRAALALAGVPFGETVSYGELAALAGLPRAARAAGAFCGQNPLGLFIPCHRVIAADGSAGGYGSYGVAYKKRLLALEASA
jgi:methylated-DNA-[protein]-cysteine S-methyltransferase